MGTHRSEFALLITYETPREIGAAYMESLRHHAVRFAAPVRFDVMRRVAVQFTLPDGTAVTTFAQVMRRYDGPSYALRLLPGVGTETLLGVAREAAWDLAENDEIDDTTDFFERRIDLPDPEAEDTVMELELSEHELTPMAEVLREGSGRFIEWLEREDQRFGEIIAEDPELAAVMDTTMVIPAKDSLDIAEADPGFLLSQMPMREKMQMAVSGTRRVREALMSEGSPSLQMWVLRNPELEEDEVANYVADARISIEAIDFLLSSPKWSFATPVVRNLAVNPALPEDRLSFIFQVLPTPILQELSRDSNAAEHVRNGANETLMERST